MFSKHLIIGNNTRGTFVIWPYGRCFPQGPPGCLFPVKGGSGIKGFVEVTEWQAADSPWKYQIRAAD